jgi:prepilin-type N-terminal cleavage/methylation domain-containing protein
MRNRNKFKTISAVTLLEVMIVVMIIGILSALALPRYLNAVEMVRAEEGQHILLSLFAAQKRYALEHQGVYATDLNALSFSLSTNPANFQVPVNSDVAVGGGMVAQVRRKENLYNLQINDQGIISCINNNNFCPMLVQHLNN